MWQYDIDVLDASYTFRDNFLVFEANLFNNRTSLHSDVSHSNAGNTWQCSQVNSVPDSKLHGDNMGPTWVLSVPDGPHVGYQGSDLGAALGNFGYITWVTNFSERKSLFIAQFRQKINKVNTCFSLRALCTKYQLMLGSYVIIALHLALSEYSRYKWPRLPNHWRNITTMSEITLHDIASVCAIWLVDEPMRWHLNSIFGERTVNAIWWCMERTHGIAESQASTCWMCCVQKLSEIRRLYPRSSYVHDTSIHVSLPI